MLYEVSNAYFKVVAKGVDRRQVHVLNVAQTFANQIKSCESETDFFGYLAVRSVGVMSVHSVAEGCVFIQHLPV